MSASSGCVSVCELDGAAAVGRGPDDREPVLGQVGGDGRGQRRVVVGEQAARGRSWSSPFVRTGRGHAATRPRTRRASASRSASVLDDVVGGAVAEGFDGELVGALAGQHHDGEGRVVRAERVEDVEPVTVGQLVVDDRERPRRAVQELGCVRDAAGACDDRVAERLLERLGRRAARARRRPRRAGSRGRRERLRRRRRLLEQAQAVGAELRARPSRSAEHEVDDLRVPLRAAMRAAARRRSRSGVRGCR